jgi:chromosome segregation ATPase
MFYYMFMFSRFIGYLWDSICETKYPAYRGYPVYQEEYDRVVKELDKLQEQKANNDVYFLATDAESEHLERTIEECRDELEEIRRVLEPFDTLAEHETALQRACNARDIILADRTIIQQLKHDLEAMGAPTSKPKKARDARGRFLKSE